jgi:hypothetical protein
MDPLVYHLDQPTDQLTELGAHTPTLARAKRLRMLGADRPRVSWWTLRAPTHVTQLFSVFAQSFGASFNHFLVLLNHLVIVNSTIFSTANSVIFSYSELRYF